MKILNSSERKVVALPGQCQRPRARPARSDFDEGSWCGRGERRGRRRRRATPSSAMRSAAHNGRCSPATGNRVERDERTNTELEMKIALRQCKECKK